MTTTNIPTSKKVEPITEKATTATISEIEGTTKTPEQKLTPDKSFARIYSSKNGEVSNFKLKKFQ